MDLDLAGLRELVKPWADGQSDPDAPLERQVKALIDLACDQRPHFQRRVPVAWNDSDVLIIAVLRKFVGVLDRLEKLEAVRREAAWVIETRGPDYIASDREPALDALMDVLTALEVTDGR